MNKNQLVAAILAFAAVATVEAEDALRDTKNADLQNQLDDLLAQHPDRAEAAYAAAEAQGWKRPASAKPDDPSPGGGHEPEHDLEDDTANDSPLLAPAIAHIAAGKHQVDVTRRNKKGVLKIKRAAHSGNVQIAEFTTGTDKDGKTVTQGHQRPTTITREHVIGHREYEDRITLVTVDGQKFTVERAAL